jgi:hypothetical protein
MESHAAVGRPSARAFRAVAGSRPRGPSRLRGAAGTARETLLDPCAGAVFADEDPTERGRSAGGSAPAADRSRARTRATATGPTRATRRTRHAGAAARLYALSGRGRWSTPWTSVFFSLRPCAKLLAIGYPGHGV